MTRRWCFLLGLACSLAPALSAIADAAPGRYTINSDGTVHDNRTGLTWQRTVDTTTYAQADAITHCTSLPLANGGWRLPTRSELLSLVDTTRYDPAIDPAAFPGTPIDIFWSSSPSWVVGFGDGNAQSIGAGNIRLARCVR